MHRPPPPPSHFFHCNPPTHTAKIHSFTRRLFKLPPAPSAPSAIHHDLPSFLAHAARIGLSPTSTTYVGTHYEYTVQETLRRSGFALSRTGGRLDAGIDLVGTWHVPAREHALRVVVQCKALKSKLGPNVVRELEGTVPPDDTLGVLVSPREATKGVRDALARSSAPLVWMMVRREGLLRQVLWNARAEASGLAGVGVEMRYGPGEEETVGLTWDGEAMPGMDAVEARMARVEREWMGFWGVTEAQREPLLEVLEEMYPAEKPGLYGGGCSSLTEGQREEVLARMRERSLGFIH
ncbi:hypothetical protein BDV59DRAFT_211802 [Aspergillus ambiguus]|uniref:uncharacterized protein n=1 Tax=Aspergillus ambiguus TaxID=176160 RepID=UPI003CCD80B1